MIAAISITAILSYLFALGVKETLKNEDGQLDMLEIVPFPKECLIAALILTAPHQVVLGLRIIGQDLAWFVVRMKAKFVLWRMAKKKEKQNPELADDLRKLMRRF